jgi:spore coat polysaccharide biosynthesis protein SpsF (cytidylyltransferase family)
MKVLIGIQARSGSTRLPNKAHALICGYPLLMRVIESCKISAKKIKEKSGAEVHVAVLTPYHDPIAFEYRKHVDIVEGPEQDVLARYMIAAEKYDADLIVRITGDCPLIPSNTIIGIGLLAVHKNYDYISNVDEQFRTSIDGTDTEVISSRLLRYAAENATNDEDREHVTTFIRRCPPEWAQNATVIGHFDLSGHQKLSVDTVEDLEAVRKAFDSTMNKFQGATRVYGKGRVHRL